MFKDCQSRICPVKMWRFLNSIPRAFRQQCHGPRASVGVHVEESELECQVQATHEICLNEKPEVNDFQNEPSNSSDTIIITKEEVGRETNLWKSRRRPLFSKNTWHEGFLSQFDTTHGEGANKKKDEGQWWRSCHLDICSFLNRSNLFEILSVGSYYGWGSENKRTARKRLLYRVLFSLSTGDSALQFNENKIPVKLSVAPSDEKNQQDGKNLDARIPAAVTAPTKEDETYGSVESALNEFQEICKDYSSKSESLQGLAAAEDGNMPVAIQHLKKACLMGNISACFNIGLCYETGSGVPKQIERAVEYYEKAAKHGHSLAMYNLGLIYLTDEIYGDSQERGIFLIEEAAKVGLAEAQTQMGIICMEQDNEVKAFDYFTAAADQKDCEAQYFLAMCYEQGIGVEEDMEKSAQYYSLAASSGHEGAMYNLAIYNELGLGGVVADPVVAVNLYKKAAVAGHAKAQSRLEELEAVRVAQEGQENEIPEQESTSSSSSLRRSSTSSTSLSSWSSSPNLIGHYNDITSLFFPQTECKEPYTFSFITNPDVQSPKRNSVGFFIGEDDDVFGLKSVGWSLTVRRSKANSSEDLGPAKISYPLHGHFHKSHTSPNLSALVSCST